MLGICMFLIWCAPKFNPSSIFEQKSGMIRAVLENSHYSAHLLRVCYAADTNARYFTFSISGCCS